MKGLSLEGSNRRRGDQWFGLVGRGFFHRLRIMVKIEIDNRLMLGAGGGWESSMINIGFIDGGAEIRFFIER